MTDHNAAVREARAAREALVRRHFDELKAANEVLAAAHAAKIAAACVEICAAYPHAHVRSAVEVNGLYVFNYDPTNCPSPRGRLVYSTVTGWRCGSVRDEYASALDAVRDYLGRDS